MEQECSFEITEKTSLDKPAAPCISEPGHSFTACILQHVTAETGCWLAPAETILQQRYPECRDREEVIRYNEKLSWVAVATMFELSNSSGCFPRCVVRHFSLVQCRQIDMVS